MSFIVNAWLERSDPHIQVFSSKTGDVLLALDSTAVMDLLEQGDVTITELQQGNSLTLALRIYSGLFANNDSKANFNLADASNSELQAPALFDYILAQRPIRSG